MEQTYGERHGDGRVHGVGGAVEDVGSEETQSAVCHSVVSIMSLVIGIRDGASFFEGVQVIPHVTAFT